MRPLVRHWRSMGRNSFIYLDDGFGSQPDKCSATAAIFIQRKELSSSGLLCNEKKSYWTHECPILAMRSRVSTLDLIPHFTNFPPSFRWLSFFT